MLYGQAAVNGTGVIPSQWQAFKFCRQSAVEGLAQAKYDLVCMYQEDVSTAHLSFDLELPYAFMKPRRRANWTQGQQDAGPTGRRANRTQRPL